tara:strand:- start:1526 stop:2296 length:771 start_codon:yes stop_codon:yes gene_type:complete
MPSRRPLIAGNWKMNGSESFVRAFCGAIARAQIPSGVSVLLLPPAGYLAQAVQVLGDCGVECGAQNVHAAPSGAYTGELAAEMVKDLGGRWLMVGHSERREYYAESDELVAEKFQAALRAGLQPILCVGETLAQRRDGNAERVVGAQVHAVADLVGASAFASATLAYEPVWAIGTGQTATPDEAQAMHAFVRAQLAQIAPDQAPDMRILYGGSMNADNARGLLEQPDIDGGLVGGASLEVAQFLEIVRMGADLVSG